MKITEWVKLTEAEQDGLAAEYGITRSGLDNCVVKEEELLKIPEVKKEVEPKKDVKKKTKKPVAKKVVKRSNKRRTAKKPNNRSSK